MNGQGLRKKRLLSLFKEEKDAPVEETLFVGYDSENLKDFTAQIKNVIQEGKDSFLVFDKTPFYAEMGGQLGDSGFASINDARIPILDTFKDESGYYLHKTNLQGSDKLVGEFVLLSVDTDRRKSIQRHHSATHILHWALRNTLGTHVHQAGSLVADDYLRFDFSHIEQTKKNQLQSIESIINSRILENDIVSNYEISYQDKPEDVLAFFGDKYGATVRIVDIGGYSKELCAGTHVERTGEIGLLKIVNESAIASGTRRIEAVVGTSAYDLMIEDFNLLHDLAQKLSCRPEELKQRFESLIAQCNDLEKQVRSHERKGTAHLADNLAEKAITVSGLHWVVAKIDVNKPAEIRSLAVRVSEKLGPAVVVLGSVIKNKVSILVLCSDEAVKSGQHAGKMVSELSEKLGGKGGGKPDFAMGGGKNPDQLEAVLNDFREENS